MLTQNPNLFKESCMRYVFVVNPVAGSGKAVHTIKTAIANLPERDSCEIIETTGIGDATTKVQQYIENHKTEEIRFFACGGDGTINEVVNGMMKGGAQNTANISFSVYPCGSGNDFVKTFGGADVFLDIEKLLHAPKRPLDIIEADGKYCVNVLNFGFEAKVAAEMEIGRARRGHGSKSDYTKGIVKALFTSMKNSCSVEVDGEVLNPSGTILLCTVANGQYVGGSFQCAPRAKSDDGLLDVCLVDPISQFKFITMVGLYEKGEHLDSPRMKDITHWKQGKSITVRAPEGFIYCVDGELIHKNEFTATCIPAALQFAVPEAN